MNLLDEGIMNVYEVVYRLLLRASKKLGVSTAIATNRRDKVWDKWEKQQKN